MLENGKVDMTITIGSDHRGYELKNFLKFHFMSNAKELFGKDFELNFDDVGTHDATRNDYPVFAKVACHKILKKQADFGILICGSGEGMAIAANRFKKIYGALCWNADVAIAARKDDGANVLVLSADFVSKEENTKIVTEMIKAWKNIEPLGDRYQKRLDMIDQ